jgi:hypothetical protein
MAKNNNIKYTGVQSKSTNVYNFEYPGEKCYCVQTVGTNRVIDTRSLKKNIKQKYHSHYVCVCVCLGFFLKVYTAILGTRASFTHSCYATLVLAAYTATVDRILVRFASPVCPLYAMYNNNIMTYELEIKKKKKK